MNPVNFILLPVALLLAAVCFPVGILFTLIQCIRERSADKALRYLSHTSGQLAVSIDLLGNVVCKDLFNALFIVSGGYGFGVVGETVSSALGKNKHRGTLTKTGRLLTDLLNILDPNHVERAAGLPFKPDYRVLRITMKLKLIAQALWRVMPVVGIVAIILLIWSAKSCSDARNERDVYSTSAAVYRDSLKDARIELMNNQVKNANAQAEYERKLRNEQVKTDSLAAVVRGWTLAEQVRRLRADR